MAVLQITCVAPICDRDAHTKGLCQKHYARQRAGKPFEVECGHCGVRTDRPKFCSPQCAQGACNRIKNKAKAARSRARWPTVCVQCGAPIDPKQNRTLCSNVCKIAAFKTRSPQRVRALKSAASARRRANLVDAETFDPIEIFERDGWRCHLCTKLTKPALRGTKTKLAPQLDHVLPLAKGGQHTRANTACSCRQCNMSKGAKIIGQPSLFALI